MNGRHRAWSRGMLGLFTFCVEEDADGRAQASGSDAVQRTAMSSHDVDVPAAIVGD